MTIAHLIDVKHLKTTLVKVKAHSRNRLNDQADQLAKAAALSAPRLNILYLSIPGLRLEITCNHLTLKTSSRRYIKNLYKA